MPRAMNVGMPAEYFEWMQSLDWMSLEWIQVSAFVPEACIGTFEVRLPLRAFAPLGLIALLLLLGALSGYIEARVIVEEQQTVRGVLEYMAESMFTRALPLALATLFALVPLVSSSIFSVFSCETYGYDDALGTTRDFLSVDLATECHTSTTHRRLVRLAYGLMLVWPVGVPLLYFVLLKFCATYRGDEATRGVARAVGFLHRE